MVARPDDRGVEAPRLGPRGRAGRRGAHRSSDPPSSSPRSRRAMCRRGTAARARPRLPDAPAMSTGSQSGRAGQEQLRDRAVRPAVERRPGDLALVDAQARHQARDVLIAGVGVEEDRLRSGIRDEPEVPGSLAARSGNSTNADRPQLAARSSGWCGLARGFRHSSSADGVGARRVAPQVRSGLASGPSPLPDEYRIAASVAGELEHRDRSARNRAADLDLGTELPSALGRGRPRRG